MILYRPHRRLLDEAMEEVRQFSNEEELKRWIKETSELISIQDVKIEYCTFDKRIGWETYYVSIRENKKSLWSMWGMCTYFETRKRTEK